MIKIKKAVLMTLLLSGAAMFTSCITTPVCVTSSTTPITDRMVFDNLGPSEGSAGTGSVLGLWMIGRPDVDKAIMRAVKKKGGDALINVRCYETTAWYILFSVTTVRVSGEVIKFRNAADEKEGRRRR